MADQEDTVPKMCLLSEIHTASASSKSVYVYDAVRSDTLTPAVRFELCTALHSISELSVSLILNQEDIILSSISSVKSEARSHGQ